MKRALAISLLVALLPACGEHVVVGRAGTSELTEDGGTDAGAADSGSRKPVDAGGPDANFIPCGSKTCGPVDFGPLVGVGPACCFSPGRCGGMISNACVELNVQGVEDPNCPSFPPYAGCCRSDDTCGFVAGAPLGCVGSPIGPKGKCVYPK